MWFNTDKYDPKKSNSNMFLLYRYPNWTWNRWLNTTTDIILVEQRLLLDCERLSSRPRWRKIKSWNLHDEVVHNPWKTCKVPNLQWVGVADDGPNRLLKLKTNGMWYLRETILTSFIVNLPFVIIFSPGHFESCSQIPSLFFYRSIVFLSLISETEGRVS